MGFLSGQDALGTGKYTATNPNVDPNAFKLQNYDANKSQTMGGYNTAQTQGQNLTGQANNNLNQLAMRANGGGAPSAAELQLQQGQQAGLAQQLAMRAAGGSGVNTGLAAKDAASNSASIAAQTNAAAGIQRANEQVAAQQQLTGALQGQQGLNDSKEMGYMSAGHGLDQSQTQALMAQQQLQSNNQLQTNQTNQVGFDNNQKQNGAAAGGLMSGIASAAMMFSDETVKKNVKPAGSSMSDFLDRWTANEKKMGMGEKPAPGENPLATAGRSITQAAAGLGKAAFTSSEATPDVQGYTQPEMGSQYAPQPQNYLGNYNFTGIGQTSDENQKKNIQQPDMKGFLDALEAHKYEYKSPEDSPFKGQGEHYSVMAQELEKTPVGKSMVMDTPQGKVVDYGKGFGALLASQAELNERLKKIEQRK